MKGWKTYKLHEITTKVGSGSTPRGGKEAYLEHSDISLIRSQNVLDFSFSTDGLAFISDEQAHELRSVTIEKDDVLLNITGDSVARVCKVPPELLPARVNQHVAIIRADAEKINSDFLKYYLLEPSFKGYMLGLASSGATRNALTKIMIENFEIKLPDLNTQHSIASILSSLDNKIELNLQMNQTLEAMAQAIFKEWFVNDKKVELSEYIDVNPRLSIKKESIVKYVEMGDLPHSGSSINSFIKRQFTSGSKFQNHDTLMARITPCLENGKTGLVDFLEESEIAYGSTEFIVMRAKSFISPYYVYLLARENNFRGFAIKSMVGTSGRQRVQTDMLNSYELSKVDESKMKEFHLIASSLFEKIKVNSNQNRALEESRDQLLPRLMSGKIEVKV